VFNPTVRANPFRLPLHHPYGLFRATFQKPADRCSLN